MLARLMLDYVVFRTSSTVLRRRTSPLKRLLHAQGWVRLSSDAAGEPSIHGHRPTQSGAGKRKVDAFSRYGIIIG